MLLATQRPAGAVKEHILTNTNLRIALRVQSPQDSSNVIDVTDAAADQPRTARPRLRQARPRRDRPDPDRAGHVRDERAGRRRPSRSARSPSARPPRRRSRSTATASARPTSSASSTRSSRRRADAGIAPPRRPWPEALGERVDLAGARRAGRGPACSWRWPTTRTGRRSTRPAGTSPTGNLLLLGTPGSGTSTALASLALTAAGACDPADLELLVLDLGPGDLAPLAGAAAHRRVRRRRRPGAAGPAAAPPAGRARAATRRARPAGGPHRRAPRRPRRAARGVRRRRGPGPARRPVPRLRRRARPRAVDRGGGRPRQRRAVGPVGGHGAEVAVPPARPLRLLLVRRRPEAGAARGAGAGGGRRHGPARPRRHARGTARRGGGRGDRPPGAPPRRGRRPSGCCPPPCRCPTSASSASCTRSPGGCRWGCARATSSRGGSRSTRASTCWSAARRAPAGAPPCSPWRTPCGRRPTRPACRCCSSGSAAGGPRWSALPSWTARPGPRPRCPRCWRRPGPRRAGSCVLVDDAESFDDADGALAGLLAAGLPDLHVVVRRAQRRAAQPVRPLDQDGPGLAHRPAPAARPGPRRRPAEHGAAAAGTGRPVGGARLPGAERRAGTRPGRSAGVTGVTAGRADRTWAELGRAEQQGSRPQGSRAAGQDRAAGQQAGTGQQG